MIMWGAVAVGCALPGSALLLRRRPLTALTALIGGSAAFVALAPARPNTVLFVLAGAVCIEVCYIAATRARRVSVAAFAMVGGSLLIPGLDDVYLNPAPFQVSVAVVTIIGWLIGNSIRQAELLRNQAAAQAAMAERLRIARELHDIVAHSIGIIAIQAGAGSRVFDASPVEARNALAAIEATSRESLSGLRRMVTGLRRVESESERAQAGKVQAGLAGIERLAAMTLDAGVKVEVDWHGSREPLPPDIDLSAFRIIQEAVTNVVRHAGTGRCRVLIDRQDAQLAIEVTDSGRGDGTAGTGSGSSAGSGAGYGITGMRERAALLGGEFCAGPRPGGGFRVAARLPVPVPASAR
ncbi:MAG TPA: sensor histidine kinase [Actinocrinis sp.]|jgi:signal transduction histidine kinase